MGGIDSVGVKNIDVYAFETVLCFSSFSILAVAAILKVFQFFLKKLWMGGHPPILGCGPYLSVAFVNENQNLQKQALV